MRKSLKILLFTTSATTILGAIFPKLYEILALTSSGINQKFYWQFLTYCLVESGPASLSFLMVLAFNIYLLFLFGSSILDRVKPFTFYSLIIGSVLTAGLSVIWLPNTILAGLSPLVYSILITWIMLNPRSELMLFFTLPFKGHWLILSLIGVNLFLNIAASDFTSSISLISSCVFGYLFSLVILKQQSPFKSLARFENLFLRIKYKKAPPKNQPKIYDIRSGKPVLNDDQFMDAMLEKISKQGESSITLEEKKRMDEIANKRKKS